MLLKDNVLKALDDLYKEQVMSKCSTKEECKNLRLGVLKAICVVKELQTVDAVRHGKWLIEAHKEKTNNRWNVTAECSECAYDLGEIWAGFFPGIPDGIAENVCFNSAKSVDVGNYCPNCGAKMG